MSRLEKVATIITIVVGIFALYHYILPILTTISWIIVVILAIFVTIIIVIRLSIFKRIRYKLGKGEKTKEYDFSLFDKSFEALQEATEPNTKAIMLREFQPQLRNLCYNSVWNDKKRYRIMKVLEYIPKKLSDELHISWYLHFLGLIIHRDKKYTIPIVKEKFLKELENLYEDEKFETNSKILNILQELHEYSEEYIMKLIDDASSRWSNKRFGALRINIEFWELEDRNKEAYEKVLRYLRRKMQDAERNKDKKTYEKFKKLYDIAKG